MDIKGFGNGIKDKLSGKFQEASDTVKTSVQNVNIPGVDLETLQETAKETASKLSGQAKENIAKLSDQAKELLHREETLAVEEVDILKGVSLISAIRLFYYLMAADGEISDAEVGRLVDIGKEFDASFEEDVNKIIAGCAEQVEALRGEAVSVYTETAVEDALKFTKTGDSLVPTKLLVWDLLTIAFCDTEYKTEEKAVVQHIGKKLKLNTSVLLEMESSIRTLLDLENELKWIKTTDRPYLKIEAMVNEIEDRKSVVLGSVNALVNL